MLYAEHVFRLIRQNKRDPPKRSTKKKSISGRIGSQFFRWLEEVFPPKNGHFMRFEMMWFYEKCLDITTCWSLENRKTQKTLFEDLFTKANFSKSGKILQKNHVLKKLTDFLTQQRFSTVRNQLIHFCSNMCLAVVSVDQNAYICKILHVKHVFPARKLAFLKITKSHLFN